MREIIIESPKHGTHTVLVDDEDYELVSQYKWHIIKGKKSFYANANNYLGKIDNKYVNKPIKLHRLIMNAPDGTQVDHKDHNGLNNQKSNLRLCNNQKNNFNQTKRPNTSSQYKGVYLYRNGTWEAGLTLDNKKVYLGRFEKEEDAAHQYDYHAIKHFGDFASLNFPDYDYLDYVPPLFSDSKKKQCSKYTGVTYNKNAKLWVAYIKVDGRLISLKCHKTQEDAARARNKYIIDNNINQKLNIIEEDNGTQENS